MSDMNQLAERAESLIGSITNAIMATAETAAERIESAAKVASIRQKMEAQAFVLQMIEVQRTAVVERMGDAAPALATAYQRQLDLLAEQELGLLTRIGVDDSTAKKAVGVKPSRVRDNQGRFAVANGRN